MDADVGALMSGVGADVVLNGGSAGACELDCFREAADAAALSSGMLCVLAVDAAAVAAVVASLSISGSGAVSGADGRGFDE